MKWRDDDRSLGLFAFLMDQTGLELVLPPCKGCGAKERMLFGGGGGGGGRGSGSEQDFSLLELKSVKT